MRANVADLLQHASQLYISTTPCQAYGGSAMVSNMAPPENGFSPIFFQLDSHVCLCDLSHRVAQIARPPAGGTQTRIWRTLRPGDVPSDLRCLCLALTTKMSEFMTGVSWFDLSVKAWTTADKW